jgi:xylogalacturonan beta-1,3-xylosyltransferase
MGQVSCKDIAWYGATPKWFNIGKDVTTVSFPSVWDPKRKRYPELQIPRPKPKWTAVFIGGYKQRAPSIDLLFADPRVKEDPKWYIHHDGSSRKHSGAREPDYWNLIQESKFGLHFHGSQPFSSRLFEIIAAGTVPVIISPGYVLPFEDFLSWGAFSISVTGHHISQLYSILGNITDAQYEVLAANVHKVSHHFRYNDPPQPGDAFYMTMLATYFRSQTISVPHVSGAIREGEATPDYMKYIR